MCMAFQITKYLLISKQPKNSTKRKLIEISKNLVLLLENARLLITFYNLRKHYL